MTRAGPELGLAGRGPALLACWPHTGAILAGGRSQRMGAPKEGLALWDGRPMLEHVMAPLGAVCQQVVIVGECRGYPMSREHNMLRIGDLRPGGGPLAGMEALLGSGLDTGYLVVACDQPFLTAPLLARLLTGDPAQACFFRAQDDSRLDPFPGYFPGSWRLRVEEALGNGRGSVRDLVAQAEAGWVVIAAADRARLRSVNTPADLARCCLGGRTI